MDFFINDYYREGIGKDLDSFFYSGIGAFRVMNIEPGDLFSANLALNICCANVRFGPVINLVGSCELGQEKGRFPISVYTLKEGIGCGDLRPEQRISLREALQKLEKQLRERS